MPLVVRVGRGGRWKLHELWDPIFHHRQVLPGVRRTQEFDVAVLGIQVVCHFAAHDRIQNLLNASFDLPDRLESKRLPNAAEFNSVISALDGALGTGKNKSRHHGSNEFADLAQSPVLLITSYVENEGRNRFRSGV